MGLVQVGRAAQVILAFQPAELVPVSDVNTKVKHPEAVEAVKGPGVAVPEKLPNNVPAVLAPSYIFRKSQPLSVAKELNVTVTNCDGVGGHIIVVPLAAIMPSA